MTDEQQDKQYEDDDAIAAKGVWGSFRIPADKKDTGPELKWAIRAFSISMIIIATGIAVGIAWSMAK